MKCGVSSAGLAPSGGGRVTLIASEILGEANDLTAHDYRRQ